MRASNGAKERSGVRFPLPRDIPGGVLSAEHSGCDLLRQVGKRNWSPAQAPPPSGSRAGPTSRRKEELIPDGEECPRGTT
ncbi:UNVERIFIED_CONTAM: hypothetical protein K2H54_057411 [Gekko kuhli]